MEKIQQHFPWFLNDSKKQMPQEPRFRATDLNSECEGEREKSNNMVRERMGVKWEMGIVVCMNSPHYMQDLHAKISHSPMLIPQPNMLIQKRNVTTLSCNTIILITYNHLLLLFHKLLTVILNQFRIKLNAYWELCYIFFFSFYNLFLLFFAVERK